MKQKKFIILCIIILISGCATWEKWEPILKNNPNKATAREIPKEEAPVNEPKVEPIVESGYYDLTAPKANVSFILYVPSDYTKDRPFPIIFCYHGLGGSATTWPFEQVTHGKGYIIVGMNYTSPAGEHLNLETTRFEKAFFLEVLSMVSARLNVDQRLIFMGGYSQGGYATTLLGEQMLNKLAGLIIMGAGRYAVDRFPPLMKSIKDKPIFIGVGQNDTTHNPRAKNAVNVYRGWRADVTFEEWQGVGHGITTQEFPSKLLFDWLNNVVVRQIAKK